MSEKVISTVMPKVIATTSVNDLRTLLMRKKGQILYKKIEGLKWVSMHGVSREAALKEVELLKELLDDDSMKKYDIDNYGELYLIFNNEADEAQFIMMKSL